MSDERWLNYKQAGELLGITPEAARHRSRRFRWRTRKDNDGKALILVPPDEAVRSTVERVAHVKAEQPMPTPDQSGEINTLNAMVNTLREHVLKLEADRDRDRVQHQAELQAERERHATDTAWHRGEIERLNRLIERPWWRKIMGS